MSLRHLSVSEGALKETQIIPAAGKHMPPVQIQPEVFVKSGVVG